MSNAATSHQGADRRFHFGELSVSIRFSQMDVCVEQLRQTEALAERRYQSVATVKYCNTFWFHC